MKFVEKIRDAKPDEVPVIGQRKSQRFAACDRQHEHQRRCDRKAPDDRNLGRNLSRPDSAWRSRTGPRPALRRRKAHNQAASARANWARDQRRVCCLVAASGLILTSKDRPLCPHRHRRTTCFPRWTPYEFQHSSAAVALRTRTRSAGVSSTCKPRRPPLQRMVGKPSTDCSMNTRARFFWPKAEMPPT